MTTRTETHLIARLDRNRESDSRLKFAHLFKVRTTNPFTLKVFSAFYDAKRAPSALRATGSE